MVEPAGNPQRDPGAPGHGVAPEPRVSESAAAPWLRIALLSFVALATLAGIAAFSYQLALARVPEHRATLERLVRARTGLDVKFNELGVRWGWYGPEAVFRRVELGEPGNPTVLLRTSELVVGFDAWRTIQSGQLEAGRITFVAPEIDLTRSRPRAAGVAADGGARHVFGKPGEKTTNASMDLLTAVGRAQWLKRWPRGRVDIESGTLRMQAPNGSADTLALQIKHASLRRVDDVWNASAQIFLPERLGRTARATLRLKGNADNAASLEGAISLEGRRLAFTAWRDVLQDRLSAAQFIPSAGGGDCSITLFFRAGAVSAAQGTVHADDVSFRRPALQVASPADEPQAGAPLPSQLAGRVLRLGFLRGDWKLARRSDGWRFDVAQLSIGPQGRDTPTTSLNAFIKRDGSVTAEVASLPLNVIASATSWFATDLDLDDAELQGDAKDIAIEWRRANELGDRLRLTADIDGLGIGSHAQSWELTGLKAHVAGNESQLLVDIAAPDATLSLFRAEEEHLDGLALTGRLQLRHESSGWTLQTENFAAERRGAALQLSGAWQMAHAPSGSLLTMRASLDRTDVMLLKTILGDQAGALFGAAANRVSGGRIEHAQFEFAGPIGSSDQASEITARQFRGSLTLRDGVLTADETWPAIKGFDVQLDWKGPNLEARVDRGSGGPFELTSLTANWRLDGKQTTRVAAQGRGRIESVLEWLRAHRDLNVYAPNTDMLAASGTALFNFTATLPGSAESVRKQAPRVRVSASLDGAVVQLIPQFPPVEAVRGTLAFDSGKLQRSALTASWLGGPVTLRFAERREGGAPGLIVQAQGIFDAEQLLAAARFVSASRVSGRSAWRGEFTFSPATDLQPINWRARIDSTLVGVASELPAPLEKQTDEAQPLRVDLDGNESAIAARVAIGEKIQSRFAFAAAQNNWQVTGGSVQFGGEDADAPERDIDIEGEIERLDLSAWLAASRQLPVDGDAIHANVTVNELLVAGRAYEHARLDGAHDDKGITLSVDSPSLAGSLILPRDEAFARSAAMHLTRLDIPEGHAPIEMGAILAALGSDADLSADNFSWRGRPLGSLTAKLHAGEGGVAVESLRLTSAFHEAEASVVCKFVSAPCRMEFELQSRDAAATLRELGFRDELTAADAKVSGEIEWPLLSQKPWLETVSGQVKLALNDGMTRAAVETDGRPFPLFAVPVLLRQSAVQSSQAGAAGVAAAAGSTPRLKFARLDADFELQDGSARTSNLHFDGDAEILMRGRTDFVNRDYDYTAWVLRGEDRLPTAVRRFGASPRVAAAWMALRDFISGPNTDRSRAVLHLGGSWDAPIIGPVQAPLSEDKR